MGPLWAHIGPYGPQPGPGPNPLLSSARNYYVIKAPLKDDSCGMLAEWFDVKLYTGFGICRDWFLPQSHFRKCVGYVS